MRGKVPGSLNEARRKMESALHCPGNLGIQFRPLCLPNQAAAPAFALYILGLADEDLIQRRILEPLERAPILGPKPGPGDLLRLLPAPRAEILGDPDAIIERVLAGDTALFMEGAAAALVIGTQGSESAPTGGTVSEYPMKEIFGRDLMRNLSLIRKRLRERALVAEPHELGPGRGMAAVVYLAGRADAEVLSEVRRWVAQRAGEGAMHRGLGTGRSSKLSLLPETLSSKWPDRVVALLDAGYVAVAVDGLHNFYVAPVTLPAMLYGPLDVTLTRPIAVVLRGLRLFTATLVLLTSGVVVALMNYHQEMMPTPFLLALASARERAPLPVVLEMLLLELFQELVRESGFHLPGRLTGGAAMIAGKVLILIVVVGGVVNPLLAGISVGMAYVIIGLLNYDLIYSLRVWRFLVLIGGGIFGFFGIAAVTFLLMAYLTQSQSFGVAFIGESGLFFTTRGRVSSAKGGAADAAAGR